jgi:hypothetical protein
MAPSLAKTWTVLIEATDGRPPHTGDVALFGSEGALTLHRVVRTFDRQGRLFFFHRGDGRGRMAIADGGTILGRAVAVLSPPGEPFPTLERLDASTGHRFSRARARSRIYLACLRLAEGTHVTGWPLARAVARLIQRALF